MSKVEEVARIIDPGCWEAWTLHEEPEMFQIYERQRRKSLEKAIAVLVVLREPTEAADRIRELEAEVERFRVGHEAVKHWQEVAHYANGVADLAMKHRDMAEARISELDAALREIVVFVPDPDGGDPYEQIAVFAKRRARAALNTQTGGWDE
jgi:hypothetical protein